jgi:hypothetical protein
MKMGRLSAWQENDRIRREGTRNLVKAALAVGGVQIFIYPSFAFVYPDSGNRWIDADSTAVQPAHMLRKKRERCKQHKTRPSTDEQTIAVVRIDCLSIIHRLIKIFGMRPGLHERHVNSGMIILKFILASVYY